VYRTPELPLSPSRDLRTRCGRFAAIAIAAVVLASCSSLRDLGLDLGGSSQDGSLPPVQDANISSLSKRDANTTAPPEQGEGMINPDMPHLVVLRGRDGRIESIWVGGHRTRDRVAIACYEALVRLSDRPASQRQQIPEICNSLPKREISPG